MLDLGHIKQMLARYDALWRHNKVDWFLIHFVRDQFAQSCVNLIVVRRNLDYADRCDDERVNSHWIYFVPNQFIQIKASLIMVSLYLYSFDTILYP